ncbi:MAG TPA: hypothetical protein VFG35_23145 [Actinoplanes sp.]|nr:hypothetical protein [Actinoplanes sp.]
MSHPDALGELAVHRPLYARMLRLKFLTPSGFLCFVFLEGAVALGILLALAELVSWWGVLVLPATVAIMVKLNDAIAGSLKPPAPVGPAPSYGLGAAARSAASLPGVSFPEHASPPRPAGRVGEATGGGSDSVSSASLGEDTTTRLPGVIDRGPGGVIKRPWVEAAEAQQQWIRQSASRRYE